MRNCEWCEAEFEPTQPEQAYCKPTHSTRASRRRHKERVELEQAGKCPTPYKRSFINEEHANQWYVPTTQYLYRCRCGAIHAATIRALEKATA